MAHLLTSSIGPPQRFAQEVPSLRIPTQSSPNLHPILILTSCSPNPHPTLTQPSPNPRPILSQPNGGGSESAVALDLRGHMGSQDIWKPANGFRNG